MYVLGQEVFKILFAYLFLFTYYKGRHTLLCIKIRKIGKLYVERRVVTM